MFPTLLMNSCECYITFLSREEDMVDSDCLQAQFEIDWWWPWKLCHSFMTLTSKVTLRKLVFNSQRTVLTKIDNFKDRAQNYFDNHSLEIPFMPGNFHDDLIFTFFLLSLLYRKIFIAQKLYPVLLGIWKFLNRKNRLTQIK